MEIFIFLRFSELNSKCKFVQSNLNLRIIAALLRTSSASKDFGSFSQTANELENLSKIFLKFSLKELKLFNANQNEERRKFKRYYLWYKIYWWTSSFRMLLNRRRCCQLFNHSDASEAKNIFLKFRIGVCLWVWKRVFLTHFLRIRMNKQRRTQKPLKGLNGFRKASASSNHVA